MPLREDLNMVLQSIKKFPSATLHVVLSPDASLAVVQQQGSRKCRSTCGHSGRKYFAAMEIAQEEIEACT